MTRAGNMRLGNRMKNQKNVKVKYCPWCETQGTSVHLNEGHVILFSGGVKADEPNRLILETNDSFC